MLFDTHTHIYLPEFDNDRDDVVHRALENGVTRLMLPNVDLDTIDALQHTLNAYPDMCSAAMGLHPTSVTENYRKDLDHIFEILDTNSYQAVGEIGIDLYWDKSYQKEQIDAFRNANPIRRPTLTTRHHTLPGSTRLHTAGLAQVIASRCARRIP